MLKATPDVKRTIRAGLRQGLTYEVIGRQLGATKSQISGLVNRNGLREGIVAPPAPVKARRGAPAPTRIVSARTGPKPGPQKKKAPPRLPSDADPVRVEDFDGKRCRYPLEDGDSWLFCNAPRTHESQYCKTHHDYCSNDAD